MRYISNEYSAVFLITNHYPLKTVSLFLLRVLWRVFLCLFRVGVENKYGV